MNKTLLLIICDFLLLNLLVLTRWDKIGQAPVQHVPVPKMEANVAAPQNDLMEAMKVALQDERNTRGQLEQRLQFSESDARTREQTLAQVKAQKAQAEVGLAQIRQEAAQSQAAVSHLQESVAQLEQQRAQIVQQTTEFTTEVKAVEAEKEIVRDQKEKQLQEALTLKEAELERQRKAAAALAQQRDAALQNASNLATTVKVVETERNLLRDNVTELKGEVAVEREEKEKLNLRTERLAGGVDQLAGNVTQLAAKSSELTEEIRENAPINLNVMFNDFLSNRVDLSVTALAPGVFGPSLKTTDTKTVLVQDGARCFAILHVTETPFSLMIPAYGMSVVSAHISAAGGEIARAPIQFSAADPRVVVVPIDPGEARAAHVKIYSTTRNPFKFTSAILISRGGRYFGEVEFKLDPRTPDYVKMKNHLVNRIFGDFSPSEGDLVLSKSGEFLGIMVNSDYCAVLKNVDALPGYTFDENLLAANMRPKLEELRARVDRLPVSLR